MHAKLNRLGAKLQMWSKEEFGIVLKENNLLQQQLNHLREAPGRRGQTKEEIKVQDKLAKVFHRKEIMCM